MFKKYAILIFVLTLNLWIWKIFSFNILLGLIVLIASISLWLSLQLTAKYYSLLFILFLLIVLFFQWQTTQKIPLTYLDNDEQRVQQMRLREHPPVYFKVREKIIWITTGNWFELRKESVAFYKIQKNFAEVVDLNLFFFANHPRERVGIAEFEKFPYVLLPAFLFGVFSFVKDRLLKLRKYQIIFASLLLPVLLISSIGHKNPLGPFSLFPFFAVIISNGFEEIYEQTNKLSKPFKSLALIGSVIIFIFVFLQIISYAKY